MHSIIVVPGEDPVVSGQHPSGFGYHETIGKRPTQEDSITWRLLDASTVPPDYVQKQRSPEAMGHRLWSALLAIHAEISTRDGCTISTNLYDGRGNIVNATLGDALSFVAVYDLQGKIKQVIRLNDVIHHPDLPAEKTRIEQAGGFVLDGRLNDSFAISRALGDKLCTGISAEAKISHSSVDDIAAFCNMDKSLIGKLQLIACCDGYSEPVDVEMMQAGIVDNSVIKLKHEAYLMKHLLALDNLHTLSESELADQLVLKALEAGSEDNISVAIQTFSANYPNPFALSVQDGHRGSRVSTKVANNLHRYVNAFTAFSDEAYRGFPLSVYQQRAVWERDNKPLSGEPVLTSPAASSSIPAAFFQPFKLSAIERFELSDLKRKLGAKQNNSLLAPARFVIGELERGQRYSVVAWKVPESVIARLEKLDVYGILARLKARESAGLEVQATPSVVL